MHPLLIFLAFLAICTGIFAWLCLTCPHGWEDDDGWHPGEREGE